LPKIDTKQRYYDLTITYDWYHFTPRMWLVGYDYEHKPLTHVS